MMNKHFITGLALAMACGAATAQVDVFDTSLRFISYVGLNSFGAAEGLHADLQADQSRDERGVLVADVYLDFRSLVACEVDRVGNPTSASISKPQNSPECRKLRQDRLDKWESRFPGSPLAAIGRSSVEIYLANLLSATDTAANEMREQHFAKALQALEAIPPKGRTPNWYVARMNLATLQGLGKKRFWPILEEAAAKFPSHAAIYEAATMHLLPYFGGSYEEVDDVAQFAASKSRAEYGEAMYAWVYETLAYGKGRTGQRGLLESSVSWPRMRTGLLELNKRHPTAWTHNRLAQYACGARDMPLLTRLIADKESAQPKGWSTGEEARCRKLVSESQEKV